VYPAKLSDFTVKNKSNFAKESIKKRPLNFRERLPRRKAAGKANKTQEFLLEIGDSPRQAARSFNELFQWTFLSS